MSQPHEDPPKKKLSVFDKGLLQISNESQYHSTQKYFVVFFMAGAIIVVIHILTGR